ncbi:MAG: flagellar motor switch protein FliN [Pseudomonadota bacterium]
MSEAENTPEDEAPGSEQEQAAWDELREEGAAAEAEASSAVAPPQDLDLNLILKVEVDVALQVGRTRMCVHELMQLNNGSIVELDRIAGEPLDVLVNGTLIARGDVVVVNGSYGIRLSEVVSPTERIRKASE